MYLFSFDVDANGSGQQASERLAHRLRAQGITARRIVPALEGQPIRTPSSSRAVTRASSSLFLEILLSDMKFRALYQARRSMAHKVRFVSSEKTTRSGNRLDQSLFGPCEYVCCRLADTDPAHLCRPQPAVHFLRWWESVHHTGDVARRGPYLNRRYD